MNFTLIICTYQRPKALVALLHSVRLQRRYPNEIIIVDGSLDAATEIALQQHEFQRLKYFKVDELHRGLTKQRNYGVNKVSEQIEIICFLDDDVILETDYFEQLIASYSRHPEALGVGGYITNEVVWQKADHTNNNNYFYFDGWMRKEPSRFKIRKQLGLAPDVAPGVLPTFSHMRAIGFLPPSGQIYPVETFMGGVASYRKRVFNTLSFSSYFEGYGLYEDADFCLRLSKFGQLYVNTAAQCEHHHAPQGRPNTFKYGNMVVRNGWYIWRVKYSNPSIKARIKWHCTALLLTILTFLGCITSHKRQAIFMEGLGRFVGWCSLVFNKPKTE